MIKRIGKNLIQFCVKNACYVLPYPNKGQRAHFLKNSALFAYVLLLLFLQLYIFETSPQILGFATNIQVDDLYSLINQERQEAGLASLSRNSKLENAAKAKAQDMFNKDYWAHYAPDGSTTPWQFITASGYSYKYAGENLAKDFDTSSGVVDAWMNSSSHRANIVNGNYKNMGIVAINGVLQGEETTLIVNFFATPLASNLATGASGSSPTVSGSTQSQAKPEVQPKAVAVVGPTEKNPGKVEAEELAVTGLSPVQQVLAAVSPATSPKTLPLGFGFFLMSLFALDEFSMLRGGLTRIELRRTGENLSHMALLGLLMLLVWLTQAGGVLGSVL